MGVDICITSSQKGLNIAPGLSFLFLSPRVLQTVFSHKSYYFDFEENLKNLERGQTPYSPATILIPSVTCTFESDMKIVWTISLHPYGRMLFHLGDYVNRINWE